MLKLHLKLQDFLNSEIRVRLLNPERSTRILNGNHKFFAGKMQFFCYPIFESEVFEGSKAVGLLLGEDKDTHDALESL